jgi:protein TonB
VVVEKMPELTLDMEELQTKVRYPDEVRLQAGTSEEALRIVKLAKFKPGLVKGKPVTVQYSLSIYFEPD